jgi:hypothetical protein
LWWLEAGVVADVVGFAYQDAGSEPRPPRRPADWAGLAGGGLIGAGIVLVLVYSFLVYRLVPDGADQLAVLLETALIAGVLAASAGLVVAGSWPAAAPASPDSRSRRRVCGGLLAASMCALPFESSLATAGDVIAGLDLHGAYLLLGQAFWLPVAAGSGLALVRKGGLASLGRPGRPRRADAVPLALLAITVAGALATMVPPFVAYTFTATIGPYTEECCNAFSAPGVEIAGTVGEMVMIVVMAAAAVLWRPARFGAVLLTGAVLSLASQATAGIFGVIQVPPPAYFGIVAADRMTISVAGTPWLWAYCGFTAALVAVYEWLFTRSRPRPQQAATPVTSTESATPGTADDSALPLPLPLIHICRASARRGCAPIG